uniref:Uncharacterized protein n=1 Tax=Anopheles arabiensis TaxID=7173 RepID=A0A8W7MU45_ANOAR
MSIRSTNSTYGRTTASNNNRFFAAQHPNCQTTPVCN